MSENINYYRDKDIHLYQVTDNYILVLQMYPDTFSYAIVHKNRLVAMGIDCSLDVLHEPGHNHDLLNYNFRQIVTGLPSTGFTLVPTLLYSKDRVADLARFLDVQSHEKVIAQPLDNENHIIYKVDESLINRAEPYSLENPVFLAKGWITAIANYNPQPNNLYLNIDNLNLVEVLYCIGDKVRFFNRFNFFNPDELVYYVALAAKELDLQPQNLNLILSGDIELDDRNAIRLADFFKTVELNDFNLLDYPAEVKPHKILPLIALSLCASSEVF
ncbi:Protein of unknown function [Mucilaginibacter mallensis]|uniref:DUF3822 domain-containing protein n=1 Tax=Mucilaginibacter mallensis TaxID=652787 RepID=A0A1H1XP10_MUCMA|nr:DUF3822 family protein [Mucilaginibacter mallensis]SDT10940.1 Protein of unknown function [Mucilaginibacter mallensis]